MPFCPPKKKKNNEKGVLTRVSIKGFGAAMELTSTAMGNMECLPIVSEGVMQACLFSSLSRDFEFRLRHHAHHLDDDDFCPLLLLVWALSCALSTGCCMAVVAVAADGFPNRNVESAREA